MKILKYAALLAGLSVVANAIVDIAPVEITGDKAYTGYVGGSYSDRTGNVVINEYGIQVKLQKEFDEKHMFFIQGSTYHLSKSDIDISDTTFSHTRFLRKITDKFYVEAFIQHKTDPYKKKDLRLLAGGNLRYKLLDNNTYGKLYIGAGLFHENVDFTNDAKLTEDTPLEDTSLVRANTYISYGTNLFETTKLDIIAYYQPAKDRYGLTDEYASATSQLTVDIHKNLSLVVSHLWGYTSIPGLGVDKVDKTVKTSINYKF